MTYDQLTDLLHLVRGGRLEAAQTMIEEVIYLYEPPEQNREAWLDSVCALLRQAHDVLSMSSLPPKRQWVGLHLDDIPETFVGDWSFLEGARWAEAKLKEKNGG